MARFQKNFIPWNKGIGKRRNRTIRVHNKHYEKGRYYWMIYNNFYHIPFDCVIHHLDGNIENNSKENLIIMEKKDHDKLHWDLRKISRSV